MNRTGAVRGQNTGRRAELGEHCQKDGTCHENYKLSSSLVPEKLSKMDTEDTTRTAVKMEFDLKIAR